MLARKPLKPHHGLPSAQGSLHGLVHWQSLIVACAVEIYAIGLKDSYGVLAGTSVWIVWSVNSVSIV